MIRLTDIRLNLRRSVFAVAVLHAMGASLTSHAIADGISFVNSFRNNQYVQTGDGNTVAYAASFFTVDLIAVNPGDFAAVALTYPGPASPISLDQQVTPPTDFGYQTGAYASQAAMDADFPLGTYQFDATGGTSGPAATSYDYSADAFSQTTPYLDGTSYSDLQGMDPDVPRPVAFSAMTPDPSTSDAFIFFTIYDNNMNMLVFDAGFLSPSTAGSIIPAGTLQPNESYTYELIYSDRVLVPSPGAEFEAQLGFDLRTTGTFTTVPEPAAIELIGLAVLALGLTAGTRHLRWKLA
jgi:hypothetical protein